MPRIQEYNPPGPNVDNAQLSANNDVREAGAVSRSIQNFGNVLEDVGNKAYQRIAQEEVSDLSASFSEARADWAQKLEEQTRNGTINTQKAKEQYQEYVGKLDQGVTTQAGRNFFERQSERLGGQIIKSAAKGQAVAAGDKAVSNYMTSLNLNSNVLQKDPESFQDVLGSSIESVDAQVQTGVIDQAKGEKLKQKTGEELAQNAIRGWAKLSPDKADEMMNSGMYDKYITGDTKAQMGAYVTQQRVAKEIEERRSETAQKKALQAKSEAWQQKALPALSKGSLPTQDILDSPMDANEKIRWLKLADESAKDSAKTNPAVKNEITRRALLPDGDPQKIQNITDMAPFVGKGLSISDAEQINGLMQKLPDEENLKDNRKRLFDVAAAKLIKKDPMMGVQDPDGEYNMTQFQVALQVAEKKMRDEKKPVSQLYDPNSKEYFGNQISKYQSSPQEILAKMSGQSQTGMTHGAQDQSTNPPPTPAPDPASEEMVNVTSPTGAAGKVRKVDFEKYYKSKGFKKR